MPESGVVMVRVASELLDQMGEWGPPVQVRIVKLHDGSYDMEARRHECDQEAAK